MRALALIVTLMTAAAACGEEDPCAGHSHDPMCLVCDGTEDTFTTATFGDQNIFEIAVVSGAPEPHVVGNNTLTVLVKDSQGNPVDGATLTAEPFYPPGGHGTPIEPVVAATGTPGEYQLTEVNYVHAGQWEVRFTVTASGQTDNVVFVFCIEAAP